MGEKVRYDGNSQKISSSILDGWQKEDRLVSFCPEVAGGLMIPRLPSEIIQGDGRGVLEGSEKILNIAGDDVTRNFLEGAHAALELVKTEKVALAILKSLSPSCGVSQIHDGTFSGSLRAGDGVTAALLKKSGIPVFNEDQIDEAAQFLNKLENHK